MLPKSVHSLREGFMAELKLLVPTYRPSNSPDLPANKTGVEFGEPYVRVLVHSAEGVRIVLGSHDRFDSEAPDIQIERRMGRWVIFLHPLPGCDPSGFVYFLDSGETFVVPESHAGPTLPIRCAASEREIAQRILSPCAKIR